jgi:uncharacterized membrane protein
MVDAYDLTVASVHVLMAVLAVGGSFFANRIMRPSIEDLPPEKLSEVMQSFGKRFTALIWASLILLGASGLLRADYFGVLTMDVLFGSLYGYVLLLKMILLVVLAAIAVSTTVLSRRMAEASSKEEAMSAQSKIKTLSETALGIGILIVLLAVALRVGV